MISFKAEVNKFGSMGEKTGWTYIDVPSTIAQKLKPGNKRSFRVMGTINGHPFKSLALIPMGEGDFILVLNATIRKATGIVKASKIIVKIMVDDSPVTLNQDLLDCLAEEPAALNNFNKLTPGHRKYFSNWIESAKTENTKAIRIANTVNAMVNGLNYGQMIRKLAEERKLLR